MWCGVGVDGVYCVCVLSSADQNVLFKGLHQRDKNVLNKN